LDRRLAAADVVGEDQQGEDPADRAEAGLLADPYEFLGYLSRRGVGEIDDHGRLQERPLRPSISSASGGPQVPARYCSGAPSNDQSTSIEASSAPRSTTSRGSGWTDGSPRSTPMMSRSSAAGEDSVNASQYAKTM